MGWGGGVFWGRFGKNPPWGLLFERGPFFAPKKRGLGGFERGQIYSNFFPLMGGNFAIYRQKRILALQGWLFGCFWGIFLPHQKKGLGKGYVRGGGFAFACFYGLFFSIRGLFGGLYFFLPPFLLKKKPFSFFSQRDFFLGQGKTKHGGNGGGWGLLKS